MRSEKIHSVFIVYALLPFLNLIYLVDYCFGVVNLSIVK